MPKRPNFVFILADDLGYGDLSCMGSEFSTPNLDRMAASGVRCTDWYSNSPVCSPSRASLLTGRYPARAGVRAILAGRRTTTGLPGGVRTLPMALGELGYRSAMAGKWHLGVAEGYRPGDRGFEDWFGFLAGCVDYYSHIYYWGQGAGTNPAHDLWDNDKEVWANGSYMTELITRRGIEFIRTHSDEPFFLYLAYNAPHYPMHAPAEHWERFAHLPPDRRAMAAMVSALDEGVGAVLDELERRGLKENTFVVFSSDNGPSRESRNWLDGTEDPYYGSSAGMLKGHKFSLFEGGIRVPAIATWPGVIPPGGVLSEPMAMMDLFPTFLRAAGGDPGGDDIDGADVLPTLVGECPSPHEALFWEMGPQTAIRRGRHKLVLKGQLVEAEGPASEQFLADLEADPGEKTNLISIHPELASSLRSEAERWREGIEECWREQAWAPGPTVDDAGAMARS